MDCRLLKNRGDRASWLAGSTINTLIRIDVEYLSRLERFFILCRMDAVNRANIDTGCILGANTRLSDHIGHRCTYLLFRARRGDELLLGHPLVNSESSDPYAI